MPQQPKDDLQRKQKKAVHTFAIILFVLIILLPTTYFLLISQHIRDIRIPFISGTATPTLENQATWIIIFGFAALAVILFLSGFFFKSTGFVEYTDQNNQNRVRTLWDWVKLLLIPLVLATGGFIYTAHQNYVSTQAVQNQEDFAMMRDYFSDMSKLIVDQKLLDPQQKTAQNSPQTKLLFSMVEARTIAVINSLQDAEKKREVMRFLSETTLIKAPPGPARIAPSIILRGVDLSNVDLSTIDLAGVYLVNSNLQGANLNGASLLFADLTDSRLDDAQLSNADLEYANLTKVQFDSANLDNVNAKHAELYKATFAHASLKDARFGQARDMRTINSSDDVQFHHTQMPNGTYRDA